MAGSAERNRRPLTGVPEVTDILEPAILHPDLEGKIRRYTVTVGGIPIETRINELKEQGIKIQPWIEPVLRSPNFPLLGKPYTFEVGLLSLKDLGFEWAREYDVNAKAEEYGLRKVPPETAIEFLIKWGKSSMHLGDIITVSMESVYALDDEGNAIDWALDLVRSRKGLELDGGQYDVSGKYDSRSLLLYGLGNTPSI